MKESNLQQKIHQFSHNIKNHLQVIRLNNELAGKKTGEKPYFSKIEDHIKGILKELEKLVSETDKE